MSGVITYTSYLVSVCSPPVYVYPNIIVNYDVETITYRHYTGGPLLTAYNTLCTFSAYSPANNAIGTVYYDASDLAIKRSCPTGYYLDGILENAPNNGNCVACSATRGDPGTSVTTYRGSFTSTEQNKYVNIYDERLMCGATACTTTDPNATRAYAGADTNYVCTNICKKGYFRDKTTGQCSVCIDAADPGTSITAFTAVNICTVSTCTPTVNHAATSVVEGKCRKTCRATYSPATNSRCCPVTGGDSGTVPTSFSSDSIADLKLPTFSFPTAIVFDSVGNMYIADAETNMIRKIDTNGIVTTYAGTGAQGSLDGPRTSATFLLPRALAVDSAGNIYVAERLIRKIDTSGTVTTYAGTGVSADIFSAPYGIAFDSAGNLYVADASHKIYKIDTSGTVTTYAGTGTPDSTDGAGDVASFSTPRGLAFDSAGNLYVADYDNSKIRKIDTSRNVTTYASSGFLGPRGLAFDSAGNLYVADSDNQSILKIDTSRNVTTYASGFSYPYGIAFDSAGNLYVADGGNYNIRKIDTSRNVTTYAGGSGRGNQNGTIGSSQTNISTDPRGTVFDKDGNMYTTDSTRHCIYKRDANGNRSLFAGISGTSGSTNGPGVSATFNQPYGIAVDSDGNLYVADSNNHKIRKIDTSGVVSTYAGTGAQGYAGGLWSVAMFNQPYGIAVDSGGNVYVADRNNHTIRMIDNTRTVTTIAGTTGVGYIDGQGITATFSYPTGVAVDSAGNVFVADTNNNKIRKIDNTVNRVVSTYAGTGSTGYNNGPLLSASFTTFKTLAVDSDGNIYGANLTKVRKIDKYRVMTLYTFPSTITSIAVKDHNTIYVSNAVTTVSLSTCKALRCTTNDTNAASTTIDSDGFCRNVCKAGSFRNSAGACEACPQDAVTSTTFSEGCKLNSCEVVNGYERTTKAFTDVSGVCRTVCRPSYVKDGSGICSVCAPGYGRDTDDICSICLDGYAGNADGWCDPCPIDPGVTATYGSGYCVVNTCTPAAGQYIQNILTGTRTSVTTTTAQKVNGKCTSVCVTGVSKDSDGLCTVLTKGYTFPTGQTIQTTELEVGTSSFPFTTSPSPMSSPPNYSMSMDINIAQVGASWRVILGSTDGGDWNVNRPATNTRRPVIGIHGNDSPPANRLYVNHTNANSDFQGQNTNFVATPGSWFNLTFTIDSTSKRGIVYINGVYDSQFSASDFAWSNPVNWTWNNSTYNKYGSVKVRNVYFYNRVLGSSEITNPISLCPRDPDTNVEFIDNSSCALSSCTTDDPNGTTVVDGSGVCRKVCKSITNGQWGVNNVDGKCTVLTCNGNYDPASLCVYVTSVTVTESPGTGTVSTIASLPDGRDTITVDSSGNLYVADGGNNKILIVNTAGVVSPYAGTGQKGSTNGPKASAQFDNPRGLAFDSAGNLYVADLGNNKIRKIDTNGVVSTYAGSGGYGAADGTWSVATFRYPRGLAVDSAGNVYVADTNNHCIRKIDNTVNRNVSTYAGIPGTYGTVDGIWSVATFRSPEGVAVDSVGNLYVADTYLGFIRKIDTNRIVSTLTSANQPRGIAVDSAGNVYVAATYSNRILNIDTNGVVSTIAGSGAYAAVDGPVTSATFMSPQGVTVDSGGNAYVVQANSSGLRKISFSVDQLTKIVRNTRLDINYLVTNLADNLTRILADALIDNIELKIVSTFVSLSFRPSGIAIDSSGNIYVADTVNNKIQKIDSNKSVSVYAGTGASGSADGPWSAATFSSPVGLAFDSDDNMYVADYSSNKIRKIDKSRTVTTYAGTGSPGSTDGQWSSATFSRPSRIAVDSDRNLYVTDSANNKIRKIDNTVNRNVTTYAGSGSQGSTDGQWSSATFSSPNGIAVDSGRNVYITELYTDKIRKIDNTVNRNVTTPILANHPRGVTFSSSGEMYFADSYSQSVRKVDKDGNISIYAGSGGYGTADGLGISATFSFPQGVAVDSSGNVYTTELDSNNIRKIS
jgi:DNA-binding beta-propeller fold protein YncE